MQKKSSAETVRMGRTCAINQVLGTDMKKHFDIVSRFQVSLHKLDALGYICAMFHHHQISSQLSVHGQPGITWTDTSPLKLSVACKPRHQTHTTYGHQ